MSVHEIQTLYKLISNLQSELRGFIGRSDTKHEQFDDYIREAKDKDEKLDSQLTAIANALLQDQTRDAVEKEVEEKTEQKEEKDEDKSSNKRQLWQTTIVLGIFSILTNLEKIFGFLAKVFSFLAG